MEKTMDKIVALAKSRGFVYPGSEIYGGACKYMGLWKSRSRTEEQREKSVVEKIRTGKSVQCRCGLRDPDESTDMDRIRTSGRIQRSVDGL